MSPALERLLLVGCSVSVPIFSSIGAIRAVKAAAAAAAAAFFYRGQRLEVMESFLVCGRRGRHFCGFDKMPFLFDSERVAFRQ